MAQLDRQGAGGQVDVEGVGNRNLHVVQAGDIRLSGVRTEPDEHARYLGEPVRRLDQSEAASLHGAEEIQRDAGVGLIVPDR